VEQFDGRPSGWWSGKTDSKAIRGAVPKPGLTCNLFGSYFVSLPPCFLNFPVLELNSPFVLRAMLRYTFYLEEGNISNANL
jgi:hypothetical protein